VLAHFLLRPAEICWERVHDRAKHFYRDEQQERRQHTGKNTGDCANSFGFRKVPQQGIVLLRA
jgi:hypothetical protein